MDHILIVLAVIGGYIIITIVVGSVCGRIWQFDPDDFEDASPTAIGFFWPITVPVCIIYGLFFCINRLILKLAGNRVVREQQVVSLPPPPPPPQKIVGKEEKTSEKTEEPEVYDIIT